MEYFENPSASFYFVAAYGLIRGVSKVMTPMEALDWMQACALLALYGIQIDKEGITQQCLGMYHNLVSKYRLHDEKNWPTDIGVVETELRRRLVSFTLMHLEQ
jgi:hypothetical protein